EPATQEAPGPASVAGLVALLRALPILESRWRDRLGEAVQPSADVRGLVRGPVARGWLTPYQANQLVLGRGRGLLLGRHVLLEKLGRGGMGQVYRARHLHLDRVDAVKVIRPGLLDDPTVLARFRREAQAVARLSHPQVITVYDAGEAGGRNFLVM